MSEEPIVENRAYFPPVLGYHDIRTKPINYFDVTVESFIQHMDFLKDNGYQTLGLDDFVNIIESKKPFQEKSVLITFDDGYQGIYKYAAPELIKRNMKAAFFVTIKGLDKMEGSYPHITTEELKEMANNPLFTIGSHTISHSLLNILSEEDRIKEIKESKTMIEKIIGKEVLCFAYPQGGYDRTIIKNVIDAGYKFALIGQDKGFFHLPARWSIPRIYVGYEIGVDLLKKYVETYKQLPAEAFYERWEYFE